MKIKKILVKFGVVLGLLANISGFLLVPIASAQDLGQGATTLIPGTSKSFDECRALVFQFEISDDKAQFANNDLLGCIIKTGKVSLAVLPFFIKYISNFLLGIIGILAVLFCVIGGYFYAFSGVMDQKDKGKKYIVNSLIGIAIAFLSWSVVQVVLSLVLGL